MLCIRSRQSGSFFLQCFVIKGSGLILPDHATGASARHSVQHYQLGLAADITMADAKKRAKTDKDEQKKAFVASFQPLVDEIVAQITSQYPDFDDGAIAWFKEVLLRHKLDNRRSLLLQ